ncbi:MAG: response regulator, partial [Lentisphaeraceae bacterium]|nr:response regulator [Lentisphaeraceae bacterium]
MPKKKQKVLIVDDIIRNIQLLAALLVKEGFEAVFATSGEGALEAVTEENPQLILLDINMPLMDGYEVCTRLKENPDTREIPVIFLTANVDEEKIIKGFEVGAVDYITKPFRAAELISRVNTHMRLQAALKAAEEANCRARAANRAKSQFLANMSHEIRTPMNAILGFSEILVDKVKDPKLLRYSKTIFSSGNALLRLINDILDLSKIEAGKFELQYTSVSVKEILNDMKFIFSGKTIKKGVDFKVELAENLPEYLLLDEVRLRQILINFIDNAIKFTDSGFIRLSVSCHDSAERRSCVGLEIDIEDSGIGIPLNQQKKIFGAFEQVIGQ